MINELRAYLDYERVHQELYYWREKNGKEVDALIGDQVAIEFKSTQKVNIRQDLKGLKALKEEGIHKSYYLVSFDQEERLEDFIQCLHWKTFLSKLWSGKNYRLIEEISLELLILLCINTKSYLFGV